MTHHLQALGIIWLLLAGLNVLVVPRRFQWKAELEKLSLFTRQVFQVHCLFIVLTLVMMGVLSLFFPDTLLRPSPLGRLVLLGLCVFWTVRLLVQWFVYDSRLWRGNRLHTVVHVILSGVWFYAAVVYAVAWSMQMRATPAG